MEAMEDIFEVWDTVADMAREISVPYQTVAKWHQRKRIPPEAWHGIIEAAARKEKWITAADLLRVNGRRRSVTAQVNGHILTSN